MSDPYDPLEGMTPDEREDMIQDRSWHAWGESFRLKDLIVKLTAERDVAVAQLAAIGSLHREGETKYMTLPNKPSRRCECCNERWPCTTSRLARYTKDNQSQHPTNPTKGATNNGNV
jgi:hypothetical protein